jgi:hypothetical protein
MMKRLPIVIPLLFALGIGSNAFGQDVSFEPATNLDKFKENLRPYDPVFIRLTVEDKDEWKVKIDKISDAIPIESIEEDADLRPDRIIFSLNLRRKEDRRNSESESPKRWEVKEAFELEYEATSTGALERVACRSHEIKERAPLGLIWRSVPEDDSYHRCLELGTQRIIIGGGPTLACRYVSIRALGWRDGHKTNFCKANGYEDGNFNQGEYRNGGICMSGPEPDICKAAILGTLPEEISCEPRGGEVYCERSNQ